MTIHIIFVLLLLGHVLGDFYFQFDTIANEKYENPKYMIAHAGIYMIFMAAVLGVGVPFSLEMVWLWLFASLAHLAIDLFKRRIKSKPFIIDQCLHFISLAVAWCIWGRHLQVRCFVMTELAYFPSQPLVVIILGLLLILKPVGILISNGEVWDFSKSGSRPNASQKGVGLLVILNPVGILIKKGRVGSLNKRNSNPNASQKGAGKMIGYLERIIVFFLLLNGQYAAIAFVIAAKSVARFPEISRQNGSLLAEDYLIGTLLSVVSAFTITLLLGLAKASL